MYLQLIYEILPMVAYAALSSRYCRGEREKTRKLTRNKVSKKKSEVGTRTHIVVGMRDLSLPPALRRHLANHET